MKLMLKGLSSFALGLSTVTALASPTYLTTHNKTNEESNAYIAGTIPSPYPTPAHASRQVHWNLVRIACYGHTSKGKCSALIKMATNTSNPIEIGYITMDIESGALEPSVLSAKGYTLRAVGPAEAEITKD
jgi:hypothetical protein